MLITGSLEGNFWVTDSRDSAEAVLGSLTELIKRGKDGTAVVTKVPRKTAAVPRFERSLGLL